MSRRAFRGSVLEARPASAWAMVALASATLWITEQLTPWTQAIQMAAILVSWWRRENPFRWQHNAIALNVGMLGVSGTTIYVALGGGPATIGLAHFAALAQALQLLDARPRRTEFLLVALALFQVVLASNLTDSVLFTPLLVAFLFATVWTLLVHTLRSEAIEARLEQRVTSALTPGLLRVTLFSSGVSVLLALALFVTLPRLQSAVITGPRTGLGFGTAGFSDEVALGDLGRIRRDSTVVMRVETLDGEAPDFSEAYWRGLAFDRFDGRTWSITPNDRLQVPGSAESGIALGWDPESANLVQRIVREPVDGGALFAIGEVGGFQGSVRQLMRDVNGGLYASGQSTDRVRYTVASRIPRRSEAPLRRDTAAVPRRGGTRYLQLPKLSARIGALTAEITRDASTDADRARAIEGFLLSNGAYTDTPPELDPDGDVSPLEAFLFGGLAAHCEYFASAFVVLARSAGLPARLVNGFAGGRENRIGDFVELRRSDAHAWAEVHFAQAGWVRYDGTPPDLRARPEPALSLNERIRQLGSALELRWFQSVVGFDRSDQMQALKRAWLAWRGDGATGTNPFATRQHRVSPWSLDAEPWRELALPGLAIVALVGLVWRVRRSSEKSATPRFYADALRLLGRHGLVRSASATARDFAAHAARALPPEAAAAFSRLTEAYQLERFGNRVAPESASDLDRLRGALRNHRARI